jgi:hypothetical protein
MFFDASFVLLSVVSVALCLSSQYRVRRERISFAASRSLSVWIRLGMTAPVRGIRSR